MDLFFLLFFFVLVWFGLVLSCCALFCFVCFFVFVSVCVFVLFVCLFVCLWVVCFGGGGVLGGVVCFFGVFFFFVFVFVFVFLGFFFFFGGGGGIVYLHILRAWEYCRAVMTSVWIFFLSLPVLFLSPLPRLISSPMINFHLILDMVLFFRALFSC